LVLAVEEETETQQPSLTEKLIPEAVEVEQLVLQFAL
jgi:hypothetical protein